MGSASLRPSGPIEAGSYAALELVYEAGFFGIDDSGSIRIVHRYPTDMGSPQFDNADGPNFVTAEASNGATVHCRWDAKGNLRPWDKTLEVRVVRDNLHAGDRIVVRYGDRRAGSPGMRMQTFCENDFQFKVLVDAFATCRYVELPSSPAIPIVPGPPVKWQAVLPTLRRPGDKFRLCLKAEDHWGNPSDRIDQTVVLKPSVPVNDLPETLGFSPGQLTAVVDDLSIDRQVLLTIEVLDDSGKLLTRSNPLRVADSTLLAYWADFHGQSEETIGTNSVRDYFSFGRDKAFLDVLSHQGNDFQITEGFWQELQNVTARFNQPGKFISFPGYEWSGTRAWEETATSSLPAKAVRSAGLHTLLSRIWMMLPTTAIPAISYLLPLRMIMSSSLRILADDTPTSKPATIRFLRGL